MSGDLTKASIVHIAPSDPLTSIVQKDKPKPMHNSHNKKDFVSDPAGWEAQISIYLSSVYQLIIRNIQNITT